MIISGPSITITIVRTWMMKPHIRCWFHVDFCHKKAQIFWGSALPGCVPLPRFIKTSTKHMAVTSCIIIIHLPSSFVSTTQSNEDIICVLSQYLLIGEICVVNRAILLHNESLLGQSVAVSGLEVVSMETISSPRSVCFRLVVNGDCWGKHYWCC